MSERVSWWRGTPGYSLPGGDRKPGEESRELWVWTQEPAETLSLAKAPVGSLSPGAAGVIEGAPAVGVKYPTTDRFGSPIGTACFYWSPFQVRGFEHRHDENNAFVPVWLARRTLIAPKILMCSYQCNCYSSLGNTHMHYLSRDAER